MNAIAGKIMEKVLDAYVCHTSSAQFIDGVPLVYPLWNVRTVHTWSDPFLNAW